VMLLPFFCQKRKEEKKGNWTLFSFCKQNTGSSKAIKLDQVDPLHIFPGKEQESAANFLAMRKVSKKFSFEILTPSNSYKFYVRKQLLLDSFWSSIAYGWFLGGQRCGKKRVDASH
jgi:hypothetical protein